MSPGLAVIAAAIDAVDFDTHPYCVLVARVDQDVGNFRRASEASLGHRHRQSIPAFAAIVRAIDPGLLGAREHRVRIGRMEGRRPDLFAFHRRFDPFPRRAVVFASIKSRLGTGEQVMGIVRRNGERANLYFAGLGIERQLHPAAPPMVAAVRTEPYARAYRSYADCKVVRHWPWTSREVGRFDLVPTLATGSATSQISIRSLRAALLGMLQCGRIRDPDRRA